MYVPIALYSLLNVAPDDGLRIVRNMYSQLTKNKDYSHEFVHLFGLYTHKHCSILKLEVVSTFEPSVIVYQTTGIRILEDSIPVFCEQICTTLCSTKRFFYQRFPNLFVYGNIMGLKCTDGIQSVLELNMRK